jgi:hypothetical protein
MQELYRNTTVWLFSLEQQIQDTWSCMGLKPHVDRHTSLHVSVYNPQELVIGGLFQTSTRLIIPCMKLLRHLFPLMNFTKATNSLPRILCLALDPCAREVLRSTVLHVSK